MGCTDPHCVFEDTRPGRVNDLLQVHGVGTSSGLGTSGDKDKEPDLCKPKAGFCARLPTGKASEVSILSRQEECLPCVQGLGVPWVSPRPQSTGAHLYMGLALALQLWGPGDDTVPTQEGPHCRWGP